METRPKTHCVVFFIPISIWLDILTCEKCNSRGYAQTVKEKTGMRKNHDDQNDENNALAPKQKRADALLFL